MAAEGLTALELWSKGGWPTVEVVGEFYHPGEIRALFPTPLATDSREYRGFARLIPEPKNRHDPNAVGVHVDGHHIGYLSRSNAQRYQRVLASLVREGMLPTTACRIWGYERQEWQGTDRRGRDVYKTVFEAQATVVLDEPHLCVPVNMPPARPHRLLPLGSPLQLKNEERHLDVLAPLVAAHGESWVYGTLRAVTARTGRSEKVIVEVHVDDQVIGELTPAMSAHFVPVIVHLTRTEHLATARVMLKGNALKVEAVLHAAKSHELGSEWIGAGESVPAQPSPELATAGASLAAPVPLAVSPPVSELGLPRADWLLTFTVPDKPSRIVFRVPPGWPPPPEGWEPAPSWMPLAEWAPPPPGWQFWVVE